MTDHLNLEPNVRMVVERLAAINLPPFEAGTAVEARELGRKIRPFREPKPVARVTELAAPGPAGTIAVRHYAQTDAPLAAILYFHGGGWAMGGLDEADVLAREIALTSGCDVYSVDYRLAPEAPYPAAIEDGDAALRWLANHTTLPIIAMGDSAGANIATVVTRRARDRTPNNEAQRIVMQILAYPVTDWEMTGGSYTAFATGPILTAPLMAWFWDLYLPDVQARAHPDASPLRADLSGMPTTFILTAENDVLHDEGKAYADALNAAGVPVTYTNYPGQVHGFLGMVGVSQGCAAAYRDIADLIARTV